MVLPALLLTGATAIGGLALGLGANHVPGLIKKIPLVGPLVKGVGDVISYPFKLKPVKKVIDSVGRAASKFPLLGKLGKIAIGGAKVGLGTLLVAFAPSIALKALGIGLIGNGGWGIAKQIPVLSTLTEWAENKLHTVLNGFSTMGTTSRIERILSDLKKAILQMLEKLINALGKETEKNSLAIKDGKGEKVMGGYDNREKTSVVKAGISKAKAVEEKTKDMATENKDKIKAGKNISQKGKASPVVNLSEKLNPAKGVPGPVAGPAMNAGKALGKFIGRN